MKPHPCTDSNPDPAAAPGSRSQRVAAGLSRRQAVCFAATAFVCATRARPALAHEAVGVVKPALAAPAIALTSSDGAKIGFEQVLRGKVTALQLMFTGCSATCPIQGAMFAELQRQLSGAAREVQLLSVSIDPLGDDPAALRAWMQRFNAGPGWAAAVPPVADVDRWFDYLRGRSRNAADRHTAQVYFFNARAELALRSTDFPSAEQVATWLAALRGSGA